MSKKKTTPSEEYNLKDYGGLNIGYSEALAQKNGDETLRNGYGRNSRRQSFRDYQIQEELDDVYDSEEGGASSGAKYFSDALKFVDAIRGYGHRFANIDPLGLDKTPRRGLDPSDFGLDSGVLRMPAANLQKLNPNLKALYNETTAQFLERLLGVYCGSVGCEFRHIRNREIKQWLYLQVESEGLFQFSNERLNYFYRLLSRGEAFEKFLHRAYPGQRWYSLEGLESALIFVDQLILDACDAGVRNVVFGMAHRGRLNFLTHIAGKPYRTIMSEFSPLNSHQLTALEHAGWMRDVKYHQGSEYARDWDHDGVVDIKLQMMPNPSHLELAHPSVIGAVRSIQDKDGGDRHAAMGFLVHGDAAFAGQGVVMEMLNMAQLEGYNVGGTIHLVLNNQLGFTTSKEESFSGQQAVDIARAYDIPVVHVNADDIMACMAVAKLAMRYREQFGKDFLVDLVGYRRFGHNENDDPSFTQPVMYRTIKDKATTLEIFTHQSMIERHLVTEEEHEKNKEDLLDQLFRLKKEVDAEHQEANDNFKPPNLGVVRHELHSLSEQKTGVEETLLKAINAEINTPPADFKPHPVVRKLIQRRAEALGGGAVVDWGHAELLALSKLLKDGRTVRFSGQDVKRGTFSQRHAVMYDYENGQPWNVLSGFKEGKCELYNSPLSEVSVVGFEYGYSVSNADALVIWEAQFGDFVNNAQSVVDELVVSGYAKWGQANSLVMLLPHGYEGQGPNHSSAHLERFIALAARHNMRIVSPTTAAQYFHTLLSHVSSNNSASRVPLVIITGKSLLRHPMAASKLEDFTQGGFKVYRSHVAQDRDPQAIERVVICNGKVFVEAVSSRAVRDNPETAIVSIEELYPMPFAQLKEYISRFSNAKEFVWLQEEPRNRGMWNYVWKNSDNILPAGRELLYVGRNATSSPAEGIGWLHKIKQEELIKDAIQQPRERRENGGIN